MKNQKLNLLFLLLAFVLIPNVTVSQQNSTTDFNINVTGFSKEYESMFTKSKFINLYNGESIEPESLKPIELNVYYSEEFDGVINLVVNYKHEDVFSPYSQFAKLNQNNRSFLGDGISIYFLNQMFNVLQRYKLEIALKNNENRIMNFFITITLQKENSNSVTFMAAAASRSYYILNLAYLKYDNQEYRLYSPQSDLSKRKFFKFGEKTDLSGTKTGFYYLDKFFTNKLEKFIDNEANQQRLEKAIQESSNIFEAQETKKTLNSNSTLKPENVKKDDSLHMNGSYDLSGRIARSLPIPVYPGNDEGLVVVKVTVDKNGNVTAAEAGARGTTIMDQRFWNEARQAALKAKFNQAANAPASQQGTISYRFKLS